MFQLTSLSDDSVGARFRRSLHFRLLRAYTVVLAVALLVLLFAPVTISVPVALAEAAGLVAAFIAMLALYHLVLGRALAPLEQLTEVMDRVDPLAPGARIELPQRGDEVTALTGAFNGMLDRLEDERRDSARRALQAQEAERRRVALELHDEVGQLLTGLVLRADGLARRVPDALRPAVEELREAARGGAEEVRTIARRLRPEVLDELGLQSALLELCAGVAETGGITVERRLDRDLQLSAEQELVIYRVAQESVTNVLRHAQAQRLWLDLRRDGDRQVVLRVRDDGRGLAGPASGNGIRGMRERAVLIGAELEVTGREGEGTCVTLRVTPEQRR